MKRIVADTSVLIEYIISKSRYREKIASLLDQAAKGRLELFVSTITLSELLYVASRIYQVVGVKQPNREALNFVYWIKAKTKIIEADEYIALEAGEIKKRFRLALPDCYVISTAKRIGATPLFKSIEKEMKPVLSDLKKLGVSFLEEI